MINRRSSASVVPLLVILFGGCPLDPTSGPGLGFTGGSSGSDGVSSSANGGSTGSSGGTTQGSQSPVDLLAAEFPGCSESPSGEWWRDEILRLVNLERDRAGLLPLEWNQALEDQATQYACEMIHYDFFAHENPETGTDVQDRAEQFGIVLGVNYLAIGENLAAGQSTPAQAMADWMDSPGHRANILSPHFTELGVGVRTGGRYRTYWVQEFGRPFDP